MSDDFTNGIFTIEIPDFDRTVREVTQTIRHLPDGCSTAIARAVNRTLDAVRGEAIRIAKETYTYTGKTVSGKVFDQIFLKKATRTDGTGRLFIGGRRGVSLWHFKAQPSKPGKRPVGGVSAQVLKQGSRHVRVRSGWSKPFIMKKKRGDDKDGGYGVFIRRDGTRYSDRYTKGPRQGQRIWKGNIEMLFGTSPIQAVGKPQSRERLQAKARETFEKRLRHEVDALLLGHARGGK